MPSDGSDRALHGADRELRQARPPPDLRARHPGGRRPQGRSAGRASGRDLLQAARQLPFRRAVRQPGDERRLPRRLLPARLQVSRPDGVDLRGGRARMTVRLRPLAEGDLRRVYEWQRDPGLYAQLVGERREVAWDEARDWMRRHWLPQGPDYRYALCAAPDGRHVGNVYLLHADDEPGTLEFHVFIGVPADRGRGFGRGALAAALAIAFDQLGADCVRLRAIGSNAAARAISAPAVFPEYGPTPAVRKT